MKTQIIHLAAAAIVTVVMAVSCHNVNIPAENELPGLDTTLVWPIWQLVAFVEADGDRILVNTLPEWGRNYTVVFTKRPAEECIPANQESRLTWCMEAQGHPNEGWFTYDFNSKDRSLVINFRGQTFVGTPPGAKEGEFFEALQAATRYRINSLQLRIFYGDGNVLLFEPAEPEEK